MDPPLNNEQRASLALSYIRMQRRLYDAVDSATVAAIHNNTPGGYSVVHTDANRPTMVVVVFGEDDQLALMSVLKNQFSTLGGTSVQPNPEPKPVGIPLRKKAQKKETDKDNG